MAQTGALTDDAFKIQLAADLIFQIQLLLREPVLEIGDFAIGLRIFDCDGNLFGNLRKKRDFARVECVFLASRNRQDSEHSPMADQWNIAEGIHTFAGGFGIHLRWHDGRIELINDQWRARLENLPRHRLVNRNGRRFFKESTTIGKIKSMYAQ